MSSGDVARRLGVSVGTISRWVRDGVLIPAFTTVGGRHRFRWSEVETQLREQRERDDA